MKAAHAIFAFILVLFPLGVLAPIIGNEKMDLPDLHPQNFNMPRKGAVTYANPRDPQGRPGLELLQGGPGDLAYGDESAVSPGTVSPGASVTISGRVGGWDVNDFTLAEVTVYIFWNTNITTPSSWVNSPPYNGITIENGTAAVTSNQTNGTAEPASGGIPLNYDYTEAGFFEATFNVPDLGDSQYNTQIGNNTITAYFLGNSYQTYYWEVGETWVNVIGSVELGTTAADASMDPGSSTTFSYRATLQGTTTGVSNASIKFDWISTTPTKVTGNTTITAPGFNASGNNVWRTDPNGDITFQVASHSIEIPFGTYTLNATIVALDEDDEYTISTTNNNSMPTLTFNNLFTKAEVTISAQPTQIRSGYSTIVTVQTKYTSQYGGAAITGIPVNITILATSTVPRENFTYTLIDNGNLPLPGSPGWYRTNSSGLIAWQFTTYYAQDDWGNFTPEGNVRVNATADYDHSLYAAGDADWNKTYHINGTAQVWASSYDRSSADTLFSIDNQWSFGYLAVFSLGPASTINGSYWHRLRADKYNAETFDIVLMVYNTTASQRLSDVPVTFWVNCSLDTTGITIEYKSHLDSLWYPASLTGTTWNTSATGQLEIRINLAQTATKYNVVVLNATANFTDFSRFKYLNGSRALGTRRYSDLTDVTSSDEDFERGFEINPRYSYGEFATTFTYSDNDTYALGQPGISTTDAKIRSGNHIEITFRVQFTNGTPIAGAPVNFTVTNYDYATNGIRVQVPGIYTPHSITGWYLTDPNGYIQANVTTDETKSPKRTASATLPYSGYPVPSDPDVIIRANVTFRIDDSKFWYINASNPTDPSTLSQNTTTTTSFILDPQYVFGSVDLSSGPSPRLVSSGGSNILITFQAKDYAGNALTEQLRLYNWSISNIPVQPFILVNATTDLPINYTYWNFTITHDAPKTGSDFFTKADGTVTFTIDPTNDTTPGDPTTNYSTPEGDFYFIINASFADGYDNLEYLNGTSDGPASADAVRALQLNTANGTNVAAPFTIKELDIVTIDIDATDLGVVGGDGVPLVKRGVTQITISGTYKDALGNDKSGTLSIGWNETTRPRNDSDIYWPQTIAVTGSFSNVIINITTASNMSVTNITIFVDNLAVQNLEFNDTAPSDFLEVIEYEPARIVSDLTFDSGPNSNRPLIYIGQSCTISGSLVDDNGTALYNTISAATAQIRGHNGATYESGTEINPTLSSGAFSGTFDVPDNYAQDTITIVVNITSTTHYNYTSSQSLILRVYSDVNQGSSQGTVDSNLNYDNTSTYTALTGDAGNIAHNEVVEIYYGNVDVSGYLHDQVNDPMNETGANKVAALWIVNGTTSWWQNTTTNSVGWFLVSFNNSDWNWALLTNDTWTIVFYFETDNGTLLWFQNITIDYHILDFVAPTHITTMEQSGTTVANATVVYGAVTLYVNATDPGPSAGVATSGIASDALTYSINSGPVQQATYNTTHWAITIDADSSTYDLTDSHSVFINVTDKHYNILQYTWVFLVDNTVPNVTAGQTDGVLLVGLATITFSLTENTTVTGYTALDASSILYDIDNSGSPQSGTANFTDPTLTLAINTAAMSWENHTVQVWVNDTAGNQASMLFNFTIDDDAPLVENWGTQVNGSKVYRGSYTISITLTDPSPGSGINDASISVYVDDPSNSLTTPVYNPNTNYYETTWDTTGYALGVHILTVQVSDVHGNQNSSILRLGLVEISSLEAQGTAPNLNWTGYLGATAGEAVNIRVEDPSDAGSLDVTVISFDTNNDQIDNISITLSETSAGSGIFIGQLYFSLQSSSASANQIKVTNEGLVSVTLSGLVGDPGAYVATWYGGTTGAIERDKPSYQNGETATITVTDSDGNHNPNAVDILDVTVFSDSDTGGVPVTLEETSANSGVFEGEVKFVTGDSSTSRDPPELKIRNDDIITFSYEDETDNNGDRPTIEVTATAIVESQDDGGGGALNLILLVIAAPVALGGGIGAAVLFERFRGSFLAK
ncbi:MAG: beta strand repeat-containing protein [Candidatus Hodarchaeales archaeon]